MALSDADRDAISDARRHPQQTLRPTVAAVEEILHQPIAVLDHGLVRVVDYMGDDGAVVQAARVSYGRGTTRLRDDRGLLRYLLRHRHTTPLEMCEIKLHVKLPIFVARQWIRHRTASVNEYSARYSVLDREFYLPRPEDLGVQSTKNRQGREDRVPPEQAAEVLALLREDAARCYDHYLGFLNEDAEGRPLRADRLPLARELSRMDLTLNYYTQWYWKIDLHNLLHFLSLRLDSHAQHEIRVYAEAIGGIVARWVPLCHEAFVDYRLQATALSRMELMAVRALLRGERPDLSALGLSAREQREFLEKLELPADRVAPPGK